MTQKDHERWIAALDTYMPRVEIVDPGCLSSKRFHHDKFSCRVSCRHDYTYGGFSSRCKSYCG